MSQFKCFSCKHFLPPNGDPSPRDKDYGYCQNEDVRKYFDSDESHNDWLRTGYSKAGGQCCYWYESRSKAYSHRDCIWIKIDPSYGDDCGGPGGANCTFLSEHPYMCAHFIVKRQIKD